LSQSVIHSLETARIRAFGHAIGPLQAHTIGALSKRSHEPATMAFAAPPLDGPFRFAVLPEHGDAILRLIGGRSCDWIEVAAEVRRSPGLLYALLSAAPLGGRRLTSDLSKLLVERLQDIGAELLRAWLMQLSWSQPQASPEQCSAHARSLLAAECALHLALETAYPHPDEAYLVGHWHALETLLIAPGPANEPQYMTPANEQASQREVTEWLISRCGVSMPMMDALRLHDALEEQLQDAHPLARLVWSARALASDQWDSRLEQISRITGLTVATLMSLRTDVSFIVTRGTAPNGAIVAQTLPHPDIAQSSNRDLVANSRPTHPSNTLRHAALRGWIRGAFADMPEESIGTRLIRACYLMCGMPAPLVVIADDDGRLRALGFDADSEIPAYYNELALRLDDATSIIALALRTGTATTRLDQDAGPGRSVADWHVSQWLGTNGLMCLPLQIRGCKAVALVGTSGNSSADSETCQLITELAVEAVDTWLDVERQKQLRVRMSAEIETRYQEHARRVVHEASNPLTVIRSYLAVMPDRHPEAAGLGDELRILQAELERLGSLLKQVAHPPDSLPEAAVCNVNELIQDMRTLYGDTLFTQRGIRLDLRSSAELPHAALPASALKQVLLNLFRNASEALQPGKRFSVVVPGQLIVNGTRCIEIRVIDNGPGLPAERLSHLFSPRSSVKGGEHQGLGLSIVNETLSKWGGSILCRSQPGSGTSFQLLVPVAE